MYQIGQAVITNDKLWFITHISGTGDMDLQNMAGQYLLVSELTIRPATEAEILAEAAKHGWVQDEWRVIDSPNKYLSLVKVSEKWIRNSILTPSDDNLAIFGNECIVADRLITALKLTK